MRQDRRPGLKDRTIGEKVEVEGSRGVPAFPPPAEGCFDGVKAGQHFRRPGARAQDRGRIDERRVCWIRPGWELMKAGPPHNPETGVKRTKCEFDHVLRRSAAERET